MSEGYDRRDEGERPEGESLDDLREEFIEKYEEEGTAEPTQEKGAESKEPVESNEGEVDDSAEERSDQTEGQRYDNDEASNRGMEDAQSETQNSASPEVDVGETDDPPSSLEEFRQEAVAKYNQEEVPDEDPTDARPDQVPSHPEEDSSPDEVVEIPSKEPPETELASTEPEDATQRAEHPQIEAVETDALGEEDSVVIEQTEQISASFPPAVDEDPEQPEHEAIARALDSNDERMESPNDEVVSYEPTETGEKVTGINLVSEQLESKNEAEEADGLAISDSRETSNAALDAADEASTTPTERENEQPLARGDQPDVGASEATLPSEVQWRTPDASSDEAVDELAWNRDGSSEPNRPEIRVEVSPPAGGGPSLQQSTMDWQEVGPRALVDLEAYDSSVVKEDAGGHPRPGNEVVVTKLAGSAGMETSDSHDLRESAEERPEAEGTEARIFEAVDYGKGAVLRLPKTDLERMGYEHDESQKKPIVELELRDLQTEDGEPKTVFARYNSADRRAEAYVGGIGGKRGDEYELLSSSEYSEERSVHDFNRNRCDHFQNVKLEQEEEGKFFIKVDDRKVELEEASLSTSGHQVVLDGKLDGKADFRIEFDGTRESVKFGRAYPVDGMKTEGDQLVIEYSQSKNEKHERRMYLESLKEPEQPSLNQFDGKEMRDHVQRFDRPEGIEGVYQFKLDAKATAEIKNLLDEAMEKGGREHSRVKAEIGERLVPNLLELGGWERIERHPFDDSEREGVDANGTDWLVRTPTKKEVMLEIKWWKDVRRASSRGALQVEDDYRERPQEVGPRVTGAYVAVMDWNLNEEPVKVYIKHVVSEAEYR